MNEALAGLKSIVDEYAATASLPELDWSKTLRSLEFQEILRDRQAAIKRLGSIGCTLCSEFDQHVRARNSAPLMATLRYL